MLLVLVPIITHHGAAQENLELKMGVSICWRDFDGTK